MLFVHILSYFGSQNRFNHLSLLTPIYKSLTWPQISYNSTKVHKIFIILNYINSSEKWPVRLTIQFLKFKKKKV